MDQFRPTILGKFLYKVVAKILIDCLAYIASQFTFCNQFSFIKRQNVRGCIITTLECVNFLNVLVEIFLLK